MRFRNSVRGGLAGALVLVGGLWLGAASTGGADERPPALEILDAMRGEANRQFGAYSKLDEYPVHYLAYQLVGTDSFRLVARWGGVTSELRSQKRLMDIDIRVGSPKLDNTHRARRGYDRPASVTIDGDVSALRADMWLEAERKYRKAVETYMQVVAKHAVKVEEEDQSPDFSSAPKVRLLEEVLPLEVDGEAWEGRARRVSAAFRQYPRLLRSYVYVTAEAETKYFVNSEGSDIIQHRPLAEAGLLGMSRAEDGMEFQLYRNFAARTAAELPAEQELLAAVREMGELLTTLPEAPLVDPFTGPAILSGRAAAVLFHEVLGHRLEGHRQKDEDSSQTFTKKIGTRILPDFISIYSDPTLTSIGGEFLTGTYRYDDEGVNAERVTLVEDGVLKAFMMSRSPVRGFPASNGHGRKRPGSIVVARQSNLIVEASRRVPVAELRRRMIRMCKKAGKPYGLIFEDIRGGMTFTGRTMPNAFNVMPVIVRRVYADGRPDELVRGVDLIGTPLSTLDRIVAAGTDLGVFNGYCGAESGSIRVGAASPSLLVAEVEVQRKFKGKQRPPLLPPPSWLEGPSAP